MRTNSVKDIVKHTTISCGHGKRCLKIWEQQQQQRDPRGEGGEYFVSFTPRSTRVPRRSAHLSTVRT